MGTTMNGNKLSNGLFGKTRQSVLALLYGRIDSSFYTKQVLDAVKTGRGTVQRELKNLTDAGIIIREVQGRQVYYRANEYCPIFNELKSIVRKTFGIADVIRQSLADEANKIRLAFIFGSVARSADDRRSDIDVMVVGNISFGKIVDLLSPAEDKLSREINAVVYPVSEFRQKVQQDHHFVKTVLDEDKIFIIGDEGELRRLVK
ncbi:MAG: nucleotidyltransferase domain-containing protein [Dehalococcoidales bacterium]|nr:nucleotidyltransferase domain-containing protein [Dehalococcoidales bacterium]